MIDIGSAVFKTYFFMSALQIILELTQSVTK